MLRRILIALSVVSNAVSVQAAEMEVTIKVPGYSEADAAVAIEIFRRNCRPLGAEFWNDVKEVQVDIVEETAQQRTARGWKNTLHLALKYADDPQSGPAFASGPGVLAGHTLYYDLGGGETPGFLAIKTSSQYLCGLAFDKNGGQIFVPVPELRFLDR